MVNFGLNAAAILGLFLAVAGAGLFFLRSIRPELARDYDIFFAAVGLLCGIILLFNGWRLEPILQFGQFMLTGTTIFFAVESIRLRGVATEQARRNTPTVDRDRPVSRNRVYTEAELDKFDTYDDYQDTPNYNSPRLRGYDDPQTSPARRPTARKRPAPTSDLRDEPRRSRSRNRSEPIDYPPRAPQSDRYGSADLNNRPRRRPAPAPTNSYDEWDNAPRSTAPRPRPRPTREERYSEPTPPTRRRPSAADLGRSYEPEEYDAESGQNYDADLGRSYEPDESIPGDYVVDYQPIEDSEPDYSDDYGDSEPDDYDDYDNYDDSESDYSTDEYPEPPQRGKPINFSNDYDRP
ncbi:Ycf66 family protein [Pleurocapsales cyanobacterium LEGE 10410]|nr:Ycf66 family protein [Pleurocapsales cyanobacterium LEGE 10410]